MIGDKIATTFARSLSEVGVAPMRATVEPQAAKAASPLGRDTLVRSAAAASSTAVASNSVTPAMIADLAKVFDRDGNGQIEKQSGYVLLTQPQSAGDALVSNYGAMHDPNTPPLSTQTFKDLMAQGYELTVKAQKGEQGVYDVIGMSKDEVADLAKALTDVLAKSPLAKPTLFGHEIPVHYTKRSYYPTSQPVDRVETWSLGKVESAIRKHLSDKSDQIKIDPLGKHPDGDFVLAIHDSTVFF